MDEKAEFKLRDTQWATYRQYPGIIRDGQVYVEGWSDVSVTAAPAMKSMEPWGWMTPRVTLQIAFGDEDNRTALTQVHMTANAAREIAQALNDAAQRADDVTRDFLHDHDQENPKPRLL